MSNGQANIRKETTVNPISEGKVFVKAANAWQVFKKFNSKGTRDIEEWFDSRGEKI